ncbi:MAG TPA: Fic family protein [Patescibacteria group bacterium]|nr:Fic family protein [Patescibacteria group bacterium]
MFKDNLNQRQLNILKFIQKKEKVSNIDIRNYLRDKGIQVSRITVVRDINTLLDKNLVKKYGKGRSVWYEEKERSEFLKYIDIDKYFKKGPDERKIAFKNFNFDVFKRLDNVFNEKEKKELIDLNNQYKRQVKKLSSTLLQKELERLTIDLSWKSSQIEGNTYSLIDTEALIKENKKAPGHSQEEATMILNHKKALDYILNNKDYFKKLNFQKIREIHKILLKNLGVKSRIREHGVGITGTKYKPLDNKFQIKEALEKLVKLINNKDNPLAKSLIVGLFISYIQPFEDGNKRTSRMLTNALLLAYNFCPLSFRSVDTAEYKKAIIVFYEQNNFRFFKELFKEQFRFAVNNYFL